MERYRLSNLKDFSMRTVVDVVIRQEGYVIGFIRHPKCWNLKDKPLYMTEEQFDNEYIKAKGLWLEPDFYGGNR